MDADDLAFRVAHRRLDHFDIQLPAPRLHMFFDRFEDLAGLNDLLVIRRIFFGEFPRIQIKVRLADQLVERLSHTVAKTLVAEYESALQVFA